jgi:mxaL protein
MRHDLRDPRLSLLFFAAALLIAALFTPKISINRVGYDLLAIVDITGSMNVRDYNLAGKPISRLEAVKERLQEALSALPCPSNVALGVFTERQPFLLFEPIDACADFSPLAGAIEALDWRMAWEGDSRISAGLFRAVEMARELNCDLLFFTDGHEAPPLPSSGGPAFEGRPGEVHGLIVGVGGLEMSPIPKFDDKGREIGFVGVDEVPHESRFGLPPQGAEQREGYNARNAPFGATAAKGLEHLSSVKEEYLRDLASKTGLTYARLGNGDLFDAYRGAATPRRRGGNFDLRPILGALAAMLLFGSTIWSPLIEFASRRRREAKTKPTLNRRIS